MCYKTICNNCKKWTYGGCGKHISQALKDIPDADLCKCKSKIGK